MAHPSFFEGWDSTDASIIGIPSSRPRRVEASDYGPLLGSQLRSTRDFYPSHPEKERAALSFVPSPGVQDGSFWGQTRPWMFARGIVLELSPAPILTRSLRHSFPGRHGRRDDEAGTAAGDGAAEAEKQAVWVENVKNRAEVEGSGIEAPPPAPAA